MKLEAEFIAKDNLLYTVSGAPVPVNGITLVSGEDICAAGSDSAEAQRVLADGALHAGIPVGVTVPWTLVEPQPEQYNEEVLAVLRDFLKRMEELGQHAVIVPVAEQADDEEERDRLTAAMRHTARRIKDCRSVIGFAVPVCLLGAPEAFVQELSHKHEHYVFFAEKKAAAASGTESVCRENGLILY